MNALPTAERARYAILAGVAVGACLAIYWAPKLVHGFDTGRATIDAARLYADEKPPTRNLTVEGDTTTDFVSVDQLQEGTNVSSGLTDAYLTIVPRGYTPGTPVKLLLKTSYTKLISRDGIPSYTGVLRNVLWEGGVEEQVRKTFAAKVALDPHVLVLDATNDDFALSTYFTLIFGVMVIFTLLAYAKLGTNKA